jgi:hypothetical protein
MRFVIFIFSFMSLALSLPAQYGGDTLAIGWNQRTGKIYYADLKDSSGLIRHEEYDEKGRAYRIGYLKKTFSWDREKNKWQGFFTTYDSTGHIMYLVYFKHGKVKWGNNYFHRYATQDIEYDSVVYPTRNLIVSYHIRNGYISHKSVQRRIRSIELWEGIKFNIGWTHNWSRPVLHDLSDKEYDKNGKIIRKERYIFDNYRKEVAIDTNGKSVTKYKWNGRDYKYKKEFYPSGLRKKIEKYRFHSLVFLGKHYPRISKEFYENGNRKKREHDGNFTRVVKYNEHGIKTHSYKERLFRTVTKDYLPNRQRRSVRVEYHIFGQRFCVNKYWDEDRHRTRSTGCRDGWKF